MGVAGKAFRQTVPSTFWLKISRGRRVEVPGSSSSPLCRLKSGNGLWIQRNSPVNPSMALDGGRINVLGRPGYGRETLMDRHVVGGEGPAVFQVAPPGAQAVVVPDDQLVAAVAVEIDHVVADGGEIVGGFGLGRQDSAHAFLSPRVEDDDMALAAVIAVGHANGVFFRMVECDPVDASGDPAIALADTAPPGPAL